MYGTWSKSSPVMIQWWILHYYFIINYFCVCSHGNITNYIHQDQLAYLSGKCAILISNRERYTAAYVYRQAMPHRVGNTKCLSESTSETLNKKYVKSSVCKVCKNTKFKIGFGNVCIYSTVILLQPHWFCIMNSIVAI